MQSEVGEVEQVGVFQKRTIQVRGLSYEDRVRYLWEWHNRCEHQQRLQVWTGVDFVPWNPRQSLELREWTDPRKLRESEQPGATPATSNERALEQRD